VADTQPATSTLSQKRTKELAKGILAGEVRAAARLMRLLDDRVPGAEHALSLLYPHTGKATIIGVTGNPGCGKSTLTDQLIAHYRKAGDKVGVVAVDPSSPFSGGAILGDRIRMMDHATDPGVFIRSLATRGQLGGLSRSTDDVINVLDAMGYDRIIVETVGVGQDEVDIVRTAQTSVVVLVPGMGDDIQAIKAGILEIADIFVVNKADREGTNRTLTDLKNMRSLVSTQPEWDVPILKTVAINGDGIEELVTAISEHRKYLLSHDGMDTQKRERAEHQLKNLVAYKIGLKIDAFLQEEALGQQLIDELVTRSTDPYKAADLLLKKILEK
jgi:LAO/AO transport system kinase